MTSRPTAAEAFVYITLPGATTPVTAGRFVLENRRGIATGRFVYGRSYLADPLAVPIDPIELKLAGTTYETTGLRGIFGALRDAGPDFWGRRVIERHAGLPALGELDYLLESPDDRAGALGFGRNQRPPSPKRRFNRTLDLEKVQSLADAIVADDLRPGDPDAIQVQDLLRFGTSMGGARPKAVIEDEDGLWIAKFNRRDDRWNHARVEHAMLTLARNCGIGVAESRITTIGDHDVLLVKRFDRQKVVGGYHRARMISGLTVLRADDTVGDRDRWSYLRLVEEMRRVVKEPRRDAAELFRRMCFNALISNTDDHPRNHALLASEADWKLSPAYDLTPTPSVALERRDLAMACGDAGSHANARNILSQHGRFLLAEPEARAAVEAMTTQVRATWQDTVRACGVRERDLEAIRSAFVYDGFFL